MARGSCQIRRQSPHPDISVPTLSPIAQNPRVRVVRALWQTAATHPVGGPLPAFDGDHGSAVPEAPYVRVAAPARRLPEGDWPPPGEPHGVVIPPPAINALLETVQMKWLECVHMSAKLTLTSGPNYCMTQNYRFCSCGFAQ